MKNLLKIFSRFVLYSLLVVVSSFFILVSCNIWHKEEPIYIAFVGPMSGGDAAGRIMTNAIDLYLDGINKSGGVNGRKVELKIFDDRNRCGSKEQAETEAKKIADDPQIVAVIGHWWSSCSIAGGNIYKKYGIPAITPGSTKKEVTEGNEWYFRNINTLKISSSFLAHYVNKVFRHEKVAVVSDGSNYGSDLAKNFEETARKLGMEIKSWTFALPKGSKEIPANRKKFFKGIVDQLGQENDTEVIMLAMQAGHSVELVKMIKDGDKNKIIIGGASLSQETFKDGFDKFPREATNPGYYTNDIYVATPLLFDSANKKAQIFKEDYEAKYPGEYPPDWSAAYAYDTAMVLIRAIKQAHIEGTQETVKTDRLKIRNVLASFIKIQEAVEGTTGYNYFNWSRDAQKPVAIGVYKNKNLVSALTQFQMMRNPNEIYDFEEAIQKELVLDIDSNYFYKTNVVYTGIKVNEISDLNFADLTFTIDFYLWFRFAAHSNHPKKIEFLNAVKPEEITATLNEKALETKHKSYITYQLYRIKGRFKADFLTREDYKFNNNHHVLGVYFSHSRLSRNNLIYVVDVLGMQDTNENFAQILRPTSGWQISQPRFFSDILKKASLGDPEYLNVQGGVKYSRFGAEVWVDKIVTK